MTLRPTDPIAAEIHDLKLSIDIGRETARGIEERRAARRWTDKAPGANYTAKDLARFRRRDYDAVKRAKRERERVAGLLARVAELEAKAAQLNAWAAEL